MTESAAPTFGDFLSRFPSVAQGRSVEQAPTFSKKLVPRQRDHFFGSSINIPTALNYSEAYGIGSLRGRKHVEPVCCCTLAD